MRRKTGYLLFLACVGLATSASAGETVHSAVAKSSCGDFEGGAYHISLVTEHDELLLYADDITSSDPWVGKTGGRPRLVVLTCDVSLGKCVPSTDAALTLEFKRFQRIEGQLTYTDLRDQKHTIAFKAKVQSFGGFCG